MQVDVAQSLSLSARLLMTLKTQRVAKTVHNALFSLSVKKGHSHILQDFARICKTPPTFRHEIPRKNAPLIGKSPETGLLLISSETLKGPTVRLLLSHNYLLKA